MKWKKASYGKTVRKGGGGVLKGAGSTGDMGCPPSAKGIAKSRVTGGPVVDTPTTKGNKGQDIKRGFPKAKAPRD